MARSGGGRRDLYATDPELVAVLAVSKASAKADEARRTETDTQIPKELTKVAALDPRTAHHLSLYHYPHTEDQQRAYFRVKIPGDGNCGFYAISLGLINLVLQGKHALPEAVYSEFINLIKKPSTEQKKLESKSTAAREDIDKRLKYYELGVNTYTGREPPRLEKCIPYIQKILEEIDAGRLNKFEQLKKYICRQMETVPEKDYFLESMMIVFGPALRKLSVSSVYNNKYKNLSPEYLEIAEQDGQDALDEQLIVLAELFDFTFKSYLNNPTELNRESYGPLDNKPNTIAIIFVEKGHWDLLLPLIELQHPNSPFLNFPSYMLQDQVSPSGRSAARLENKEEKEQKFDKNKLPEGLQTLITKSRKTAQQVKRLLKAVDEFENTKEVKEILEQEDRNLLFKLIISGMRKYAYELMDPTVKLDYRASLYAGYAEMFEKLKLFRTLENVRKIFYSMTKELRKARSDQTDFNPEDDDIDQESVDEVKSQNNDLETCCKPLYDHAKALFLENGNYQDDEKGKADAERDWQQFEAKVQSGVALPKDTKEKNKAVELLKVYQGILGVKQKLIDAYVDYEQQESEEKAGVSRIINSALVNPELQNERENMLITCVRAVLVNLSFILVVPAVVNWCKNKSVLYHHKTKSVELLEDVKQNLTNTNKI